MKIRVTPFALLALFSSATLSGTVCYTLGGGVLGVGNAVVCFPTSPPPTSPCPQTSGPLALVSSSPRLTGISPLLVFFNSTGTTDSAIVGNTTVFQDVTFSEDFGDTGTSGSGTWLYGSRPNVNSRNVATGAVAAHLFVTQGADTTYTVTTTATDAAANTIACTVQVTAYDPNGANGFGTRVCQANGTLPVAGAGGCPAGASVSNSASESTNLSTSMNNKMVLFKCGDTFSGSASYGGTKFSIGAYGGCEGTQTNRPIFNGNLTVTTGNAIDGRISDIDFESTGAYAINAGFPSSGNQNGPMTLWNLNSTGNTQSYTVDQGQQWALVQTTMTSMGGASGDQGVYINYGQNNCSNLVLNAYPCSTGVYQNIDYFAALGNHWDGGSPGGANGVETVRVGACRFCTITNSDFLNANPVGAVLKLHNGNTYNTQCIWTGQWTENVEVSDNFFGGQSGAQLVEMSAQNQVTDERMRNFVVERNVFHQASGSNDALSFSVMNGTIRDNAFNRSTVGTTGVKSGNRGFQGTSNNTTANTCTGAGTTSAPVLASYPQYDEVYNDTCYQGSAACVVFGGGGEFDGGAGNNSFAKNILAYQGSSVVADFGTGNAVSNNTTSIASNPGFLDASGTFNVISDFKPTANYTGGTSVPVLNDALGTPWFPTWDYGAVHH